MKEQMNKDWGDDPRITAYALGEMDEAERVAFEGEIRDDEVANALVAELRALGRDLEEEFAGECTPGLSEGHHQRIEAQLVGDSRKNGQLLPFSPWALALVGVAATAVVGIGMLLAMYSLLGHKTNDLEGTITGALPSSHTDDSGKILGGRVIATTSEDGAIAIDFSEQTLNEGAYSSGSVVMLVDSLGDEVDSDGTASVNAASVAQYSQHLLESKVAPGTDPPALKDGQLLLDSSEERITPKVVMSYAAQHKLGQELSGGTRLVYETDSGEAVAEGNREQYSPIFENAYCLARQEPLSTFSVDVDTASYANVRRFLDGGNLPPADAVRIEELINYFPYDYENPGSDAPFSVDYEVGACPWEPRHRLVRIGLKGRATHHLERPPSNLVFLVDVSGSMNSPDKLPLLKKALHMLVQQLDERDLITIVVYASAEGLALPPTPCTLGVDIHMALERLSAGGSTNGGAGINLAYEYAMQNFIEGGINRVILATDGDFNVGVTSDGALVRMIEQKAKSGVFLSVLGFGTGNLQDAKMEQLADKGNGNYSYIDSVLEARKVLVEEMGSTLETIAKDVKIQVEFNPVEVKGYRLIGYENRMLAAQDFNDDTKDAGEIGAGHTVTALYEIVPAGAELDVPGVDPLKYQVVTQPSGGAFTGELCNLKLRYKEPDGDTSKLLTFPITDERKSFEQLSADTRWAASVAAFGLVLRDSRYKGDVDLATVSRWAIESVGEDPGGYRAQFIGLVGKARQLKSR